MIIIEIIFEHNFYQVVLEFNISFYEDNFRSQESLIKDNLAITVFSEPRLIKLLIRTMNYILLSFHMFVLCDG